MTYSKLQYKCICPFPSSPSAPPVHLSVATDHGGPEQSQGAGSRCSRPYQLHRGLPQVTAAPLPGQPGAASPCHHGCQASGGIYVHTHYTVQVLNGSGLKFDDDKCLFC